jgi:Ca2+-binding EF-hand superfamily protein
MESSRHRIPVHLPINVDPDPNVYDVLNGKVYMKDDRLSYLEGYNADEYTPQLVPSTASPDAKYKTALRNYAGKVPKSMTEVQEKPLPEHCIAMRGYSGFIPHSQNTCGEPVLPGIATQMERTNSPSYERTRLPERETQSSAERYPSMMRQSGHVTGRLEQSSLGSAMTHYRTAFSSLELEERYAKAIVQLSKRKQTQDQLCRILQTKMGERVTSFSDQVIRARKQFHYFDMDGDGALNEDEFRQMLVMSNVFFDDIQALAVFAFIDTDCTGMIGWEAFEYYVCVQDPQTRSYLVPKAITSPGKSSHAWENMGLGLTRR